MNIDSCVIIDIKQYDKPLKFRKYVEVAGPQFYL